jgi:hypothetical protein
VNGDVISFVALDKILGFFFRGVVSVALETHVGNDFLHDRAANASCFRIPCDVVSALERPGHLFAALRSRTFVPPGNCQKESAVNDAFNIVRNAAFQREHLTSRQLYRSFRRVEPDAPIEGLE